MLRPTRVRRGKEPQGPAIDPEFAELIAALYYAFEDNLERCARLTRLHDADTGADGGNADAHERRRRRWPARAGSPTCSASCSRR